LTKIENLRIGQGIPTELRLLCYRKQNSDGNSNCNEVHNNDDDNDDDDDDDNDDDEDSDTDSDTFDRMPCLVSYYSGSFRSLSSSASNKGSVTSCGIDFADDCSSIPSINTIKTFATTESEVATVKTRNFIPGVVTTQRERRWDEDGGDTCIAGKTAMCIDSTDAMAVFSPLTATPTRRKTMTTRRGHTDSIPIPTLRSDD
jgi:hypothetical protein